MGKINQMSEALSNMIAAGEVVDNMASVVKELVENALDANSRHITIRLLDAGMKEIRVSDDGDGIEADDLPLAFKRHATSKIRTQYDLYRIASLGFRGEALPSIASVAVVSIVSSTAQGPGRKITVKHGAVIADEPAATKQGTTVTVNDLFYNTPARLKHLKSEPKELADIISYVNRLALAHADVSFSLVHNQKDCLSTPGDGDIRKIYYQIYGADVAKRLVSFHAKDAYFEIEGYLAKPPVFRAGRQHVTMIVNGRVIESPRLRQALIDGVKGYFPIQKYPIAYLRIQLDPTLVDVNIHPRKLHVKFTEEALLASLIENTVKETLSKENLIHRVRTEPEPSFSHPTLDLSERAPARGKADRIEEEPAGSEKTRPPGRALPGLDYIGQALGTYLVFQNEEGVYLLDQHAAAERIRYERYLQALSKKQSATRALLIPLHLHYASDEIEALKDHLKPLREIGVQIGFTDDGRITLHATPEWFPRGEEEAFFEAIVKHLSEGKAFDKKTTLDALAILLACKHSIKANRYLNRDEVDVLLADLADTNNPYQCPHGRPTLIHFSETELEKMFQRIVT